MQLNIVVDCQREQLGRVTKEQILLPPTLETSSVTFQHYPWPILAALGHLLRHFNGGCGFVRIHRREQEGTQKWGQE